MQGVTRLEKLVFLLERETSAKNWLSESADFRPYNYGPFSAKVYQAVDMLSAAGLIVDSKRKADTEDDTWEKRNVIGSNEDPYTTRDFRLTDRGWRYYSAIRKNLVPEQLAELSSFKETFATISLRQLVRYVYERYDDFTSKSFIRDSVLGR